jgi:hypothetical protein
MAELHHHENEERKMNDYQSADDACEQVFRHIQRRGQAFTIEINQWFNRDVTQLALKRLEASGRITREGAVVSRKLGRKWKAVQS